MRGDNNNNFYKYERKSHFEEKLFSYPIPEVEEEGDITIIVQANHQEEHQRSCWSKFKAFLTSEKIIVIISKLAVFLTGMVGPLMLLIQEGSEEEHPREQFFGFKQIIRNDHPFQKAVWRYAIVAVFLFLKKGNENSQDFITNSVELTTTLKDGAILGFLDFIQVQCFIFSIGYTSLLRATLFSGTQLFIMMALKSKEGARIQFAEIISLLMALGAQVCIGILRVEELNKKESYFLGDIIALLGGVIGSIAYFYQDFRRKDYYKSSLASSLFSLCYAILCSACFDARSFLFFQDHSFKNIALMMLIGSIECIAILKKIKTFVFQKYIKNIFEPIVAFKFELVFGFLFIDSWTILIVFGFVYVPANLIMMKLHSDDIKANVRSRDSTFIDILNFEEYIEMKDLKSPMIPNSR